MQHRRTVLGTSVILLSGCLTDGSHDDDAGTNEDDPEQRHDEEDDVPYDIPGSFFLGGQFVEEGDVEDGFEVLPSAQKRFDGLRPYTEFFEKVEGLPEADREPGLGVGSDSVEPASEDGIALRETIADIRDEMDADWHPNDGSSRNYGTHYVEHDGSVLRVFMRGPGTPEEDE